MLVKYGWSVNEAEIFLNIIKGKYLTLNNCKVLLYYKLMYF